MVDISREIYINCSISSNRIAVLEEQELVQLFVDFPSHTKMVGNIYNGVVQNVIPGIQAAFIDINHDINAFLPLAELENEHNLKMMLKEKLMVMVNSDDPAYFGGYVNIILIESQLALDLSMSDMKTLIINSFKSSFLNEEKNRERISKI